MSVPADRIAAVPGVDQADAARLSGLLDRYFSDRTVDLAIDDASHLYGPTRTAFEVVFPYLRPGGIYLIEDWGWAHWRGVFDGAPPALLTSPDVLEPVAITDLAYDAVSRRFTATVFVGPSAAERRVQAAVSGTARRVVEIAVLTRAVERGEAIRDGDYRIERRAAELVPADVRLEALGLDERVARRALAAGTALRPGDLERPVLVGRNDAVLMIYEQGALTLTLRGRARQAGSLGDLVDVENPVSERVVQAEVIGPGRVRVGPALSAGRMAALAR